MSYTPLIDRLVEAFRRLPGVGPKSAQRMVLYFLEKDRQGARTLAESLLEAVEKVGHCNQCRTLSETDLCHICSNPSRDQKILCVVEAPADIYAIEQTAAFRGRYFVLMGHLSPIDGVGPEEIGIRELLTLVSKSPVEEVIIATNPTVEGDATAYFIAEQLQSLNTDSQPLTVSRIAHGVPLGGELEYIDGGTLIHSLEGRQLILNQSD